MMQIYKCDRCGKVLEPKDRFCGHVACRIADLCENCWHEFNAEKEAVEKRQEQQLRIYEQQLKHLQVKYGMLKITETLERRIENV